MLEEIMEFWQNSLQLQGVGTGLLLVWKQMNINKIPEESYV